MRKPIFIVALLLIAASAKAVKVGDITRLYGHNSNKMYGLGLVTGLKGTGDGGSYSPAMQQLAKLLTHFADPATIKDLGSAANVAIVSVTVVLPEDGWHLGDKVDAYITSVGAAGSLSGGRLFQVPMEGDDHHVHAFSEGQVTIEDTATPTGGVVKNGCVMDDEFHMPYVHQGQITLILENAAAGWVTANAIAQIINQSEASDGREILAQALDPKTVEVAIPLADRERPDAFIARIQRLPIQEISLNNEARVQINERSHTMIITGDVEISPVVISHKGLTITTVSPPVVPSARTPVVRRGEAIPLDTTGTGGAKLQDLVNALDQLKVPAEDRITIIKELYKTGKLHAKLVSE